MVSASDSQSDTAVQGSNPALWPLAGFVLGRPEFKSSATLVNSQLVASSSASWGLNSVMLYLHYLFLSI